MKAVIYPVCAVLSLVALVSRVRLLRRGREPAVAIICFCFGLAAFTFTVSTPAVTAWLDRLIGVPNLTAFFMHISFVMLSFAIQAQVLTWAYEPAVARAKLRARLFVLVGVVVVMAILFVMSRQTTREARYLLEGAERGGTAFTIYLSFYLAAVGGGYGIAAWMSWRYARVATRSWLQRGLRISAVGFALVLGYVGTRLATLLGARLGVNPESFEFLVPLFIGLSLPLTLVGLTLPSWGPNLEDAVTGLRRRRDLHGLEPLWRAFYEVVPGIALDPRHARRFAQPGEVRLRLLRRVVEISDGRLTVAPYVSPPVAVLARERGVAAGLSGAELAAVVEASQIAAGLAALERGDAPVAERGGPASADGGPDGDDLATEVTRLLRVTRAFTSSPVVETFRGDAPATEPAARLES